MDTRDNIFIGFTSALLCWQVIGRKGFLPGTDTDLRSVQSAISSVAEFKRERVLDHGFVQRLGMPLHVLVPSAERRFRSSKVRCHVVSHPLPTGGLRHLCRGVFVTSPEVTFVHMGTQLTRSQLALVGMQLCGTYTLSPQGLQSSLHNAPLATIDGLSRAAAPNQRMLGAGAARSALVLCAERSNSPRESLTFLYLTLPGPDGGYELERPELNRRVDLSARAAAIAGTTYLHPDFCWPGRRVIMEYDSNDMHREAHRLVVDDVRAEAFRADGWQVVTLRTNRLSDVFLFDAFVRKTLAPALCATVPAETAQFNRARAKLRRETLHFDPYDALQANKVLGALG